MEPDTLPVVAAGYLGLMKFGYSMSYIPGYSENTSFDGGTNVLHQLILYIFRVCVSGEELEAPPVTPSRHSSVRLLFGLPQGSVTAGAGLLQSGRERNGVNWGGHGGQ